MQSFHSMNGSGVPVAAAADKRSALPVPGLVAASRASVAHNVVPAAAPLERVTAAPESLQVKSEAAPAVVEYTAYSPTRFKHQELQS
jgi:hypothetical protein